MKTWVILCLVALSAEAGSPPKASVSVNRARSSGRGAVPANFLTAVDLCAALAANSSMEAGNWWCLDHTGSMLTGSAVTLAAVNAPVSAAHPVCPSGANCTDGTDILLNPEVGGALQYYATASNVTPPTGSFTTCALGWYEQTNKASGGQPQTPWVMMSNLAGGTSPWGIETPAGSGATGLQVTCANACGSPTNSGVQVYQRNLQMNCGVFESGVRTRSCTYVSGSGTMTCVDFAHAVTSVVNTPRKWVVGINNGAAVAWQGFMRGVFMTEKALTTAEMETLGRAVSIGPPAGQTFTRASKASCCRTADGLCGDVDVDSPCVLANKSVVQAAGQNFFQGSERVFSLWSTDDNIAGCVTTPTLNDCYGPYGMKTADSVSFCAASGGQYSRSYVAAAFGSIGTRTVSLAIKGTGSTLSGTVDLCTEEAGPVRQCVLCPYTSTWSRCSMTIAAVAANVTMVVGNLPLYSGIARSAQSVCITNGQGEKSATETSYINTGQGGTGTLRAVESCTGLGCP